MSFSHKSILRVAEGWGSIVKGEGYCCSPQLKLHMFLCFLEKIFCKFWRSRSGESTGQYASIWNILSRLNRTRCVAGLCLFDSVLILCHACNFMGTAPHETIMGDESELFHIYYRRVS